MDTFSLTSTVKLFPDFSYEQVKNNILGTRYDLSLTFVGSDRARSYNKKYRQKSYVPNVLSFPLSDNAGEIIICPQIARREAPKFNLSPDNYIKYLFIHGLIHLKGYDHGASMDTLERRYLKKYSIV